MINTDANGKTLQTDMMLSIIVPIYKIEEFLRQCVESILAQSFQDFELILVDDGSPDSCPEICEQYAEKDSRIKVIHKLNGGLVSARKAGLKAASGEYIGYVDGDDWIEPDFYEKLMRKAMNFDADIVAAGFIKVIGDNLTLKNNPIKAGYYNKSDIEKLIAPKMMFDKECFEPGLFTYVWNKIFKKSVLYNAQMNVPESISLGEDAACVFPAVLQADSIYITDDCLYNYRQRADSMLKVSENYKDDYVCYRFLYSYLSEELTKKEVLKDELKWFLVYLITTRCGGLLLDNSRFYLFDKHPSGERLAIYGAGTFGQHLVKRLSSMNNYEIVKWVDEDYSILKTHGLKVDSPNSICEVAFDSIIIAFLNRNVVLQTKRELICQGVSEESIISADFLNVDCNMILHSLGVIDSDQFCE